MDDSILNKLRKTKDMPPTQNITSIFLLFVLFIAGYFVFFFNPSGILQVLRTPLVILYILLVVYVGFYIFKRIKKSTKISLIFSSLLKSQFYCIQSNRWLHSIIVH